MAITLTGQQLTTISANGNRFINVGAGSAATDGVNYSQLLTAPELFNTADTVIYNITAAGVLAIVFKTNGDLIDFINEAQYPLSQTAGELTETYTGGFQFSIGNRDFIVTPAGTATTFNWVYDTDAGTTLEFTGAESNIDPPLNTAAPVDQLQGTLSTVIGRFPVSTLIPGTGLSFEVDDDGLLRIDTTLDQGIPEVADLPTVAGDLGEIVTLTTQVTETLDDGGGNFTTTFAVGAYYRAFNNGQKRDFRRLGEDIIGDTLPTLNLHDERLFYLDSHTGTTNIGWYIYHTPNATRTTGEWSEAGESTEARKVYPEFGNTVASSDSVEPFELTPGIWTWDAVVYLFIGLAHNISGTQDAWDNAPRWLEDQDPADGNAVTGDLRAGWQEWDTFANSTANQIAAITYQRNAAEKTEDEWIAGDGFTIAADGDYVVGDTFFYINDSGDRANYVVIADFTAAIDPDPATADAYILNLIGTEIAVTAAGNFVAVAANALNFIGLGANNHFLTNMNHQMEFATEQNHNYHIDLLYFSTENGRMILNTDNLQTALDAKEDDFPSLGLGSMIVDASLDTTTPPNWVAFKPLMTGLDAAGNEEEQNFAVETASDDHQHWPTTKEWQEDNLLEKVDSLPGTHVGTTAVTGTATLGDNLYLTTQYEDTDVAPNRTYTVGPYYYDGTNWNLVGSEIEAGTGVTVNSVTSNGITTTTISADTILNRADVTVPSERDVVTRTGPVESINTFYQTAINTPTSSVLLGVEGDTDPQDGNISFVDTSPGFTVTTDWQQLNQIRIQDADVDAKALFDRLQIEDHILVVWNTSALPDITVDTANWALLEVDALANAPLLNVTGLGVKFIAGEFGGTIQNTQVTLITTNVARTFDPDVVLRFIQGTTLANEGVFSLVPSGIETVTTGANTNTQIERSTNNVLHTATLQHAFPNAMAYLAIQLNSSFEAILPTTYFTETVTAGESWTYIHYTSNYDGVDDINYVDRVATITATGVTTTITRRFGTAALPATGTVAFDNDTNYPILPQV